MRGVAIEPPSADTLARLKAAGIDVKPARIVDLTLAGTRYDVMKAALDILTSAPEFDLILAVVGSSARFHPELAVEPIVDSAGAAKPIAAYLVPDAPAGAGHAERGRRAELPHAGGLRRRDRGGAAAACAAAAACYPTAHSWRNGQPGRDARLTAAAACSTSSTPHADSSGIGHSARAVGGARRRPRRARRPCRSPIRSPSRRCRPRSRTRPTPAASCSASRTARR